MVFVLPHFCFFPTLYCHNPFLRFCVEHYFSLYNVVIFILIWLCIDFLVCAVGFLPFWLLMEQVAVCLNTAMNQVCRYMGNFQSPSFLLGNNILKMHAYNAKKSKHYQVNQVPFLKEMPWRWALRRAGKVYSCVKNGWTHHYCG